MWSALGSGKFLRAGGGGRCGGLGGRAVSRGPSLRRRFSPPLKASRPLCWSVGAQSRRRAGSLRRGAGEEVERGRDQAFPAPAAPWPRARARALRGRESGRGPGLASSRSRGRLLRAPRALARGGDSPLRRPRTRRRWTLPRADGSTRPAAAGELPGEQGAGPPQRRATAGAAAGGEQAARVPGGPPPGRPGPLLSPCPSTAPGPRPRTPRRAPETPALPRLAPGPQPFTGAGTRPAPHLPALEPPSRGRPDPPGSASQAPLRCWAPLRRPVWGDAGPFFLFLAVSRASAPRVKSEHPRSGASGSGAGVIGTRGGLAGRAARLFPPPPRAAAAVPTLAAVASWQVSLTPGLRSASCPSSSESRLRDAPGSFCTCISHLWRRGGSTKLLFCCENSLLGLHPLYMSHLT